MLKEKGPKTTRIGSIKKLLERVEGGSFVLNRSNQAFLPGGISEDDLDKELMIRALKLLIKEDEEKVDEKPIPEKTVEEKVLEIN